MPRVGDVFQLLSGTLAVPNTTIQSGPYNAQQNDWVTEANSPRPVSAGGTGETTAAEARESLGAIGVGDLANADTKAVMVQTDSMVIIDSEDDNTNKRWLVSDLTTYMRTISPPTGLNRNRLVNGAFQINQQNPGVVLTANGDYPVDQWKINTAGLTGVISCEQQTAESDSTYSLRLQVAPNQPIVTSGYWLLNQTIEGIRIADFKWGAEDGNPIVLRLRFRVNTRGTYGFFIHNTPRTHTYAGTFTVGADESIDALIEKIIPIPAPPSGSVWAVDTSAGITLCFTMAAPTASLAATAGWSASTSIYGVTGQMNVIGILSAEIEFSAVALYLDPDNTGVAPKWEMPDEAEELRACQRYWATGKIMFSGQVTNATGYRSPLSQFPVAQRATPTVTGVDSGTGVIAFPAAAGSFGNIWACCLRISHSKRNARIWPFQIDLHRQRTDVN